MFKLGKRNLQAGVFDLDGTLVDSNPAHKQARADMLLRYAKESKDPAFIEVFSKDPEIIIRMWQDYTSKNEGGYKAFVEHFLKTHKIDMTRTEFMMQFETELFKRLAGLDWKPGAEETIKFLREMDIPLALATNSDREEVEAIDSSPTMRQKLRLLDGFDTIVTASDAKEAAQKKKPEPWLYLRAMQLLGKDASSVLSLEDSLMGVTSARNAGIPKRNIGIIHDHDADTARKQINKLGGPKYVSHANLVDHLKISAAVAGIITAEGAMRISGQNDKRIVEHVFSGRIGAQSRKTGDIHIFGPKGKDVIAGNLTSGKYKSTLTIDGETHALDDIARNTDTGANTDKDWLDVAAEILGNATATQLGDSNDKKEGVVLPFEQPPAPKGNDESSVSDSNKGGARVVGVGSARKAARIPEKRQFVLDPINRQLLSSLRPHETDKDDSGKDDLIF